MGPLILNGVYDLDLFKAIKSSEIVWGVDFRGRSPQLMTFNQFKEWKHFLSETDKVMIIFENESDKTIFSFLNLISEEHLKAQWSLQFRDQMPASYYQQFQTSFSWVFHPEGEWREILSLEKLESVILPVNVATQVGEEFWDRVDARGLEVVLHFQTFQEFFQFKNMNRGVSIGLDLTQEVELSYRRPNLQQVVSYLKAVRERREVGDRHENFIS